MAIRNSSNLYHPVSVNGDFIRRNAFELVVASGNATINDNIRLMCKTFTLQLPKTNAVQVPWINGVMQVAGRISAFNFSASFLVGLETGNNTIKNSYDTLTSLYEWRNLVMGHDTGCIGLPSSYKKDADLFIHDVRAGCASTFDSGAGSVNSDSVRYKFKIKGLWPTSIDDIQFDVEQDSVLEITAQFAADLVSRSTN